MQFPYDPVIDESVPFEREVRQRLFAIENTLVNVSAQCDLVQELIRKDISNYATPSTINPKEQVFVVTTMKNQEDVPQTMIRIAGSTYDIRQQIRDFGSAVWKGELKSWELEYSEERYHNIVEYLTTLTTNIREELIVVEV
jgi:hypothetical protein